MGRRSKRCGWLSKRLPQSFKESGNVTRLLPWNAQIGHRRFGFHRLRFPDPASECRGRIREIPCDVLAAGNLAQGWPEDAIGMRNSGNGVARSTAIADHQPASSIGVPPCGHRIRARLLPARASGKERNRAKGCEQTGRSNAHAEHGYWFDEIGCGTTKARAPCCSNLSLSKQRHIGTRKRVHPTTCVHPARAGRERRALVSPLAGGHCALPDRLCRDDPCSSTIGAPQECRRRRETAGDSAESSRRRGV